MNCNSVLKSRTRKTTNEIGRSFSWAAGETSLQFASPSRSHRSDSESSSHLPPIEETFWLPGKFYGRMGKSSSTSSSENTSLLQLLGSEESTDTLNEPEELSVIRCERCDALMTTWSSNWMSREDQRPKLYSPESLGFMYKRDLFNELHYCDIDSKLKAMLKELPIALLGGSRIWSKVGLCLNKRSSYVTCSTIIASIRRIINSLPEAHVKQFFDLTMLICETFKINENSFDEGTKYDRILDCIANMLWGEEFIDRHFGKPAKSRHILNCILVHKDIILKKAQRSLSEMFLAAARRQFFPIGMELVTKLKDYDIKYRQCKSESFYERAKEDHKRGKSPSLHLSSLRFTKTCQEFRDFATKINYN